MSDEGGFSDPETFVDQNFRMPVDAPEVLKIHLEEGGSTDREETNEGPEEPLRAEEEAGQREMSARLKTCRCSADATTGWKVAVNRRKVLGLAVDTVHMSKYRYHYCMLQKVAHDHGGFAVDSL